MRKIVLVLAFLLFGCATNETAFEDAEYLRPKKSTIVARVESVEKDHSIIKGYYFGTKYRVDVVLPKDSLYTFQLDIKPVGFSKDNINDARVITYDKSRNFPRKCVNCH